jgi:hypothetical protein
MSERAVLFGILLFASTLAFAQEPNTADEPTVVDEIGKEPANPLAPADEPPSADEPATAEPVREEASAAPSDKPPASGDSEGEAVIQPGQEELLATMLGKGEKLPGECVFTAGRIEHTFVRGTYTCPGGEVVIELVHPSKAPASAQETEHFAIVVASGSPPSDLAPALEGRIRAREGDFKWFWLEPPRRARSRVAVAAAGLAVVILVAVLWLLRRRRGAVRTQ